MKWFLISTLSLFLIVGCGSSGTSDQGVIENPDAESLEFAEPVDDLLTMFEPTQDEDDLDVDTDDESVEDLASSDDLDGSEELSLDESLEKGEPADEISFDEFEEEENDSLEEELDEGMLAEMSLDDSSDEDGLNDLLKEMDLDEFEESKKVVAQESLKTKKKVVKNIDERKYHHPKITINSYSLIKAAKVATPETLRHIMKKKIDINFQNKQGESALIVAAKNKRFENVNYLIKSGANIEVADNAGKTAFDYAKANNDLRTLKYFENDRDIASEEKE